MGWRRASEQNRQDLARWLVARAVEHDAPSVLIALIGEHLRPRQILRPPLELLIRMVTTARAQAHREIEALLDDQLAPKRRDELDGLLDPMAGQASEIADLRGRAKRAGVKELLGQVARYLRLVELGALEIDVSVLPPARRRALEAVGRRMTAQRVVEPGTFELVEERPPRLSTARCWCARRESRWTQANRGVLGTATQGEGLTRR